MPKEYLYKAHEHVHMSYQSLDSDGVLVDANDNWLSMMGYAREDVIGRWFGEVLTPESREQFREKFPLFKQVGIVSDIPLQIVKKDGSVADVLIDGKIAFDDDGSFERTHCICRSAAEGVLQDSGFQNTLDRTTVPVVVFDAETLDIVDVNISACDFYGYSYKQFMRMTIADINVISEEQIREYVANVKGTVVGKFRVKHLLSDGSVRVIEPKPTRIVYNGRAYMLVLMIDVTEEVLSEKKLTAALELSKKLLEPNIPLVDVAETVLTYAKELTGAKDGYVATIDHITKDLLVHTFTNMMDTCNMDVKDIRCRPDRDGLYPALFGHSLNTRSPFYVNDIPAHPASKGLPDEHMPIANGLFYPVMLHGEMVGQIALANNPAGFKDDDLKVIEEISTVYALALKGFVHSAEEYKFQEIFNSIVEGISILKPVDDGDDFVISDINRAGQSIASVEKEDAVGSSMFDVFPNVDSEYKRVLKRVHQTGKPERLGIKRYRDSKRTFLSDSYIFRLPTGLIIVIYRDLSELHNIQSELKQLNENLLERVEAEVGIRRKQEQVIQEQKKLADLGQMINAIAHQWRQPINALGLFTQEVADLYKCDELTDEYIDEFESGTMNLVNHLSSTIDDFRFFFKTDKDVNKFEVISEVFELVKLLKVQLSANHIKVEVSCECSVEPDGCQGLQSAPECEAKHSCVTGFRGEFRQVVLNLMHNAADAIRENMQAGEISRGMIRVSVLCSEGAVVVKVADNGAGIPDKVISKIFNPYFTTKGEGKGTGIGLYMSKIVIEENMGGRLEAESPDGALFTVTLPKSGRVGTC